MSKMHAIDMARPPLQEAWIIQVLLERGHHRDQIRELASSPALEA
jgi:hypothetical protein